jgi:glycosyltransferase involved in cell wall biosynthesis
MHILILPSWYRTPDKPLIGSFFREQAIALAGSGEKISLMYLYTDSTTGTWYEEHDDEGVHVIFIHFQPVRARINRFLIMKAYVTAFRKFFTGDRPDIIHAHSYSAGLWARMVKLFCGVPYVITEHSTAFGRNLLSIKDAVTARLAFQGADAVIAVSDGLKARIKPYCGGKKVVVIPNMVSDRFFEQAGPLPTAASGNASPDGVFRFLSVGYLDNKKGMDVAISAMAKLLAQGHHAQLVIVGGGTEMTGLQALTEKLGIASSVVFTGTLPREEVATAMHGCDAFVLASRVETFGIVSIEALACGKPVIMTDTDAARTIINENNGLVVAIDDIDELCAAMINVISNHSSYDPALIAQDCKARFSETAVCNKIKLLYGHVGKVRVF